MSYEKEPERLRKCKDIAEWPALREEWVSTAYRYIPQLIGSRASNGDLADEWLATVVVLTAVSIQAADLRGTGRTRQFGAKLSLLPLDGFNGGQTGRLW